MMLHLRTPSKRLRLRLNLRFLSTRDYPGPKRFQPSRFAGKLSQRGKHLLRFSTTTIWQWSRIRLLRTHESHSRNKLPTNPHHQETIGRIDQVAFKRSTARLHVRAGRSWQQRFQEEVE